MYACVNMQQHQHTCVRTVHTHAHTRPAAGAAPKLRHVADTTSHAARLACRQALYTVHRQTTIIDNTLVCVADHGGRVGVSTQI